MGQAISLCQFPECQTGRVSRQFLLGMVMCPWVEVLSSTEKELFANFRIRGEGTSVLVSCPCSWTCVPSDGPVPLQGLAGRCSSVSALALFFGAEMAALSERVPPGSLGQGRRDPTAQIGVTPGGGPGPDSFRVSLKCLATFLCLPAWHGGGPFQPECEAAATQTLGGLQLGSTPSCAFASAPHACPGGRRC